MKVTETTKTIFVTKQVEVIKEVPPPACCLDTFVTKLQLINETPHCDHPAQTIHTASFSRANQLGLN